MIIPKFLGRIEKGKLIIDRQQDFEIYLAKLCGDVEVTVCRPRKQRSNSENSYYFGVVVPILSEHTGYTPDEIHSLLKEKFLSKIIVVAGKDEKIPRSSTELSTIEWEKWMTEIREWASIELNCYVALPNEVTY